MGLFGKKLKVIIVDTLGIILIILAGLTGWIPGPGGIPLLIAGLALLSINHEWAKRWLVSVKDNGLKISDKLFSDSPKVTLMIDLAGIAIIALAVFVVFHFTHNIAKTAAIWLMIVAITLLLGNRGRIKKITKRK